MIVNSGRRANKGRRTKDEGRINRCLCRFVLRPLSFVLLCTLAGCSPAAIAQGQGAGSGGALEVVLAGKPAKKTLTLTTTQPAGMEALEQTPIHSKLAAYVAEVLVDYGDKVKKDQPLIQLSAPELDAQQAQKQAALEQARSE